MKKIIIVLIIFFAAVNNSHAQDFIEKAKIEFEVKSNIKKKLGSGGFLDGFKDQLPNFRVQYFDYIYANNKSIFKINRTDPDNKIPDFLDFSNEGNEWYSDYNTGITQVKKFAFGTPLDIKDSLPAIEWKLVNESMNIAGFNCRKAVTKIYDSVYVFVFYTEELPISGGPCGFNGLPGMILGMTIPRLYTSWVATKVTVTGIDEKQIKADLVKKPMSNKEWRVKLLELTKDWGSWGGGDDEGMKRFREQFIWSLML